MDNKAARKKDVAILIAINAALAAVALLYVVLFDTGEPKFTCPFYDATAIPCPTCGGSRSLFALFHFKILSSVLYYPPLALTLVLIAKWDILAIRHALKSGGETPNFIKRREVVSTALFIVFFFLLRAVLIIFFKIDLTAIAASLNF